MTDIQIEREHSLGLPRAREAARQWTAQAESDYGLDCRYEEGAEADEAFISGMGAEGRLQVTAGSFRVQLALGPWMAGFAPRIEAKLSRSIDALLEVERPADAA